MAGRSMQPGRTVVSKISMIMWAISDGSRSLTDIATRCELPLSTVHRLASDLAAWQLLERTNDGSYRAGRPLCTIATAVGRPGSGDDVASILRNRAIPIMEDLVRATGTCVRVGKLDRGIGVAYVQKGSLHDPVSRDDPTVRMPAHATALGKALLAFSPPHVVNALMARGLRQYTPATLTDPRILRTALRTIRSTRLAVSRHELSIGRCAIAAPVLGVGGLAVAAIELETDDLARDVPTWRPALIIAAGMLSREMVQHYVGGASLDLGATGT